MTEPPADPTTKPLEGFGVWGPNVVGWGSDDDPLAALRAELLRARSELQLGGGQPAAETLARVRARLAAAAEPQTVPPGADSAVVQAAAHATIARLTAFSMSSIDISMLIALRRARNPKVPIENRIPDRIK